MRICLYTHTALPKLGGQESVVDSLARHLQSQGHEPFVLAPNPRRPLRANDSTLPYPVLRHPRFLSTRRGVSLYHRFLLSAHRRHHFDIIHCHDVYPSGYLAALNRNAMNIPLILTSHGGDIRQGNLRLSKPGMRPRFEKAIQTADALIAIAPFTRAAMLDLGADPTKIIDIPNGVDTSPYAHPTLRPPNLTPALTPQNYFLFLGRLAPRKGLDILLSAMSQVPTAQLAIAGTGEQEPALRQQIETSNLSTRVHLLGRVTGDAKTHFLQNALATILPSRDWEAFPLVVLESYAAARPVIATAIPGLSDVVQNNRTGLLIPPENPQALAAAMQRLLDDPPFANSLGQSAATLAAAYDWTQITQQHIALYNRLTKIT